MNALDTFDLRCDANVRTCLEADLLWKAHRSRRMWFADHPVPPDVIGLNYYVTSDRFIDDRLDLYVPGAQGDKPYVDVEAVRVQECGPVGHAGHLRDTWQRYKLPVAFTEVHVGCTREEQLRWLRDAWARTDARSTALRSRGHSLGVFGSVTGTRL